MKYRNDYYSTFVLRNQKGEILLETRMSQKIADFENERDFWTGSWSREVN